MWITTWHPYPAGRDGYVGPDGRYVMNPAVYPDDAAFRWAAAVGVFLVLGRQPRLPAGGVVVAGRPCGYNPVRDVARLLGDAPRRRRRKCSS